MEPNEELLPQELAAEKAVRAKIRTEVVIGGLALIIILLCGVIWYIAGRPITFTNTPTASTTPITPAETGATPLTLNEDSTYYTVTASYPSSAGLSASAGAQSDAKAVAAMKGFEQNTIDAFKEQGNFANLTQNDIQTMGFDQGRKESVGISYVEKKGAKTLSYVYTITEDTFGAHPNTYYRTFTYDAKTGTGLTIADVFSPGTDYNTLLSNLTRKALPTIIASHEGISASDVDTSMIQSGTLPEDDSFQNWYIDDTNLVIIFPPYQVAAYAAGEIEVRIPFSQLSSSLSATYK